MRYSKHFNEKHPKGNPEKGKGEKVELRNAVRRSLPFPLPFYFLYIQYHRKKKKLRNRHKEKSRIQLCKL